MSKIALGTVQFGLDYGISNKCGQVGELEVAAILSQARQQGVNTLDTAPAYGNAEHVLGHILQKEPWEGLKIVSKIPPQAESEADLEAAFRKSLSDLGQTRIYGLLFHNVMTFFQNPNLWPTLERFRAEGWVEKVGFSLYSLTDFEKVQDMGAFPTLVQVPYNVFDQRFREAFFEMKNRGIEVHARSVFLQGLFFLENGSLPDRFRKVQSKLQKIRALSFENEIPLSALLLNFALHHPAIEKVVIGVESLKNLEENLAAQKHFHSTMAIMPDLYDLAVADETVINPTHWN